MPLKEKGRTAEKEGKKLLTSTPVKKEKKFFLKKISISISTIIKIEYVFAEILVHHPCLNRFSVLVEESVLIEYVFFVRPFSRRFVCPIRLPIFYPSGFFITIFVYSVLSDLPFLLLLGPGPNPSTPAICLPVCFLLLLIAKINSPLLTHYFLGPARFLLLLIAKINSPLLTHFFLGRLGSFALLSRFLRILSDFGETKRRDRVDKNPQPILGDEDRLQHYACIGYLPNVEDRSRLCELGL